MLEAIAKNYKFEKPVEISTSGDKAEVEVKVTSVDVGVAMTSTISEAMPIAFASAFNEQTPEAEKAFENLMIKTATKHLTSKDATMATRTVKLNLEKNKDGEYKIVSDENLEEAILANSDSVEQMFGGGSGESVGEEVTEEPQPEQESKVVLSVAKYQKYDVNPINMNVEEVSIKKTTNVTEDETGAYRMDFR